MEADYFVNINYIVKNLCINKENPAMHCNGKCYLAKKLKEQEKQEQAPVSRKNNSEVILFFAVQEPVGDTYLINSKISYQAFYDAKPASFPRSVFHPPTV